MTTPSELADELEAQSEGYLRLALVIVVADNLPTILSALRRVEKMEEALKKIAQSAGEHGERGTTGDGHQQAIQDARQALTGEA